MKKFLFATVALIAVGATAPALAADLGTRYPTAAPVYAAPIYNWTGFYIGAHVGGAFSSDNNFNNGLATGNSGNGRVLGGFQGGYDLHFAPNWVAGIEGEYSWLSGSVGAVLPGGFLYTNDQRGIGSVTGRLGYTWGPGLLYVKGGYAFSDNNETVTAGVAPVAFAIAGNHRDGYTVGAGLEYMFAQNWSAKAEYQYYDFGTSTLIVPVVSSFRTDDHTVKAGVNYRFNWGGPVARY